MNYTEVFGTPQQRALVRRSEDLWRLVRGNPRLAYYGNAVSLSDPAEDTAEVIARLARIQGLGMCFYCPKSSATEMLAGLEAQGFRTAQSQYHRGAEGAYDASKGLLARRDVPQDLSVIRLDVATPKETVAATAELCVSCGVTPMPGEIMRGTVLKGATLVALDAQKAPVATASSFAMHAPDSPRATDAFWGVLATREDRRGQGLAALLGAMAIVHMWENEGMRGFNTGIKAENLASQAACSKLGVVNTDMVTAFCFDDGRMAEI